MGQIMYCDAESFRVINLGLQAVVIEMAAGNAQPVIGDHPPQFHGRMRVDVPVSLHFPEADLAHRRQHAGKIALRGVAHGVKLHAQRTMHRRGRLRAPVLPRPKRLLPQAKASEIRDGHVSTMSLSPDSKFFSAPAVRQIQAAREFTSPAAARSSQTRVACRPATTTAH